MSGADRFFLVVTLLIFALIVVGTVMAVLGL
jgi:predicted nucleic acid-binding Zn ribbon protein